MERSEQTEKKGDGEIPGSRGDGDGGETRASREGGDQETRASREGVEGPESAEKKQAEKSEQTEKKVMEQAEDEASSSSWIQMVAEAKMLDEAVRAQVPEAAIGANHHEVGPSSSHWVVETEKLVEHAGLSEEMVRWEKHSIYRVPQYIKDRTNRDAYGPMLVSLGPYHHGEPALQPMEQHKRRAVLHRVRRSGRPLTELVGAVKEVADELQSAYDELDDQWRGTNRDRFVEMMLTDGCFLLELIWAMRGNYLDYAPNDPVFSSYSFTNLEPLIKWDVLAMENQVPLLLLQRLEAALRGGTPPSAKEINEWVLNLMGRRPDEDTDTLGLHPLDIYHRSYCGPPISSVSLHSKYESHTPSAVELSEAGVQFKKSNAHDIHDINFENGVLSMPPLYCHNDLEKELLNLMAFEWLHPSAGREVSHYITFVCNIVASERDVALLRCKRLLNTMGSDKKVVAIYNTLVKLSWPNKGNKLGEVQWNLTTHCKKRRNKWGASFVNTYLSNPWVFISLVAAAVLLVATVLQTMYTVVPFYTKKH